jgi:predicted nucleic acid-binding protein
MIVYLDANIVIYFVEMNPVWGPKVQARLTSVRTAGDQIAVSDAARLECLVGPHLSGDAKVLADYMTFFNNPSILMFPVTATEWERGARIRATHGFKPLDAIHLAVAAEQHCGLFLTNDAQLARFPDVPVEVLK